MWAATYVKAGRGQVGSLQVGPAQVSVGQVGSSQVGHLKVDVTQVQTRQVGTGEVQTLKQNHRAPTVTQVTCGVFKYLTEPR